MIMIEASSSAYPGGRLAIGNQVSDGGAPRRFYTKPHQFYGGIALHARTMDACLHSQHGESMLHRTMNTRPEAFLKAIGPSRAALVVAVAWIFTWYGLAALWAREGLALVRGHALSRKAMHGGKAHNANMDAQTIAVLRRGGLRPQAPVQQPNRQSNLPERGKKSA
jgi:hypothetical protein